MHIYLGHLGFFFQRVDFGQNLNISAICLFSQSRPVKKTFGDILELWIGYFVQLQDFDVGDLPRFSKGDTWLLVKIDWTYACNRSQRIYLLKDVWKRFEVVIGLPRPFSRILISAGIMICVKSFRYIERFSLDCRKGLVLVLVLVLLRPLVG